MILAYLWCVGRYWGPEEFKQALEMGYAGVQLGTRISTSEE